MALANEGGMTGNDRAGDFHRRNAGVGPEADETGLTGYFFFTAVLAGSVALAAAGAGDVGGPGCTDSPNNRQRPSTAWYSISKLICTGCAGEIAFEMQHALGLVERRRLGQLRRDDAHARQIEPLAARSAKDCDRRAAVLASRKPGAPISRNTVKLPV